MSKEQIIDISFSQTPDVKVRVIEDLDSSLVKKNKKQYPFELQNSVKVTVKTTKREFSFLIYKGYTWNGADIPRFFWRSIGSRTDIEFLVASMLHDYLLEFKTYIMKEILNNTMTKQEYRRLTSLVFREKIKAGGTNVIKANVMSWFVDVFQMINMRGWKCL